MEVRYTAERRDVAALLSYNLRHSPRLWAVLVAIGFFPLVLGWVLTLASRRAITGTEVIVDLVFGVALVGFVLFRARSRVKSEERALTIGPDGIRTTVGQLAGEVPWSGVAAVDVTPDYIFITGKNSNGFAIPGRAFANDAARAEFLSRIAEYRGSDVRQAAL